MTMNTLTKEQRREHYAQQYKALREKLDETLYWQFDGEVSPREAELYNIGHELGKYRGMIHELDTAVCVHTKAWNEWGAGLCFVLAWLTFGGFFNWLIGN